MATIHKKVWSEYFEQIIAGKKKFELRLADFEVNEGDTLVLEEWDKDKKEYTGRKIEVVATYIIKTKSQTFWSVEEVEKYGFQVIQFEPKGGKNKDWSEYFRITGNNPPSKLLVKSLGYVAQKSKAIDVGGGALKDTRYLLEQGFDVTVVDKSDLITKEAEAIKSDNLHYFVSSFEDFDFPKNEYDIASAMYALPFNPPESFDVVFAKIKGSLVKGGIFCGQFFGVHDEWSNDKKMTFHTKEQVEKLLSDMEVILFDEEEKDDKTANGTSKHWHIFHFIVRKL
ncbi:MAG: DUF3850 domain-containing protein [bacterium]|nr:DUF3850 domain-containing protein [bacterium]